MIMYGLHQEPESITDVLHVCPLSGQVKKYELF